jgi:hypothetical protein
MQRPVSQLAADTAGSGHENPVAFAAECRKFAAHRIRSAYLANLTCLNLPMLCPRRLIQAATILAALACHAGPSAAQVRLTQAYPTSGQVRMTQAYNGLPLDEVLHLEFKGRRFDVPAAYLQPWQTRDYFKPGVLTKVGDLSFSFWMPTREYLTFSRSTIVWYHPTHDPAYANGYVVDVGLVKFDVSKIPGQITPAIGFQNHISVEPDAFAYKDEYGLTRYWDTKRPSAFIHYRHLEGTQPQVKFRCVPQDQTAPNASCSGSVYFEDTDMQFFIAFSILDLPLWREAVTAAHDLIRQWEVKGTSRP